MWKIHVNAWVPDAEAVQPVKLKTPDVVEKQRPQSNLRPTTPPQNVDSEKLPAILSQAPSDDKDFNVSSRILFGLLAATCCLVVCTILGIVLALVLTNANTATTTTTVTTIATTTLATTSSTATTSTVGSTGITITLTITITFG